MSKALVRLHERDEDITEDFSLYINKQRERILQKISDVHLNEKNHELLFYAYLSQAYITRIDPPMTQESHFELLSTVIYLIPTSQQEKFDYFIKPLGEMIDTVMSRKTFKVSKEKDTIELASFWETIHHILSIFRCYLLQIDDESYKIE